MERFAAFGRSREDEEIVFHVWILMVAAVLPPHAYVPCTPGLTLVYQLEQHGQDTGSRLTDRVREMRKSTPEASQLCVVERTTQHADESIVRDAYALEHLEDRVLSAGWWPQLVAFRVPLLRAPLKTGARWRFAAVEYRVTAVDAKLDLPAGRFDRVLVIEEHAVDGSPYRAQTAYAPGIGVIRRMEGTTVRVLMRVHRPRKGQSKQTVKPRDGPPAGVVSPSPGR